MSDISQDPYVAQQEYDDKMKQTDDRQHESILDSSDHEQNMLVLKTVINLKDRKMSQMTHYTNNKKKRE